MQKNTTNTVTAQRRPSIPAKVQSAVLLANRHACCVCQKPRVQLHHIDEDPSNNVSDNLAALCTDHHDMASMQIGLTKKLTAAQVRVYKKQWEQRCERDLLALARDREAYFCTLYKNPPRVRELFSRLDPDVRHRAVERVMALISEEEPKKAAEGGFNFQSLPRTDQKTLMCLSSAALGELWPQWLQRVPGHPEDPDLPTDLSPPYGMAAFHTFDQYVQVLVQVLSACSTPVPLEDLLKLKSESALNAMAGCLVSFRERAYGKGIASPRAAADQPTGRVLLRTKIGVVTYRTEMALRNMYVFSDTAAINLRSSRVCGIGVFGGADVKRTSGATTITLNVVPLLIGMGGFGQSDSSGWSWNLR